MYNSYIMSFEYPDFPHAKKKLVGLTNPDTVPSSDPIQFDDARHLWGMKVGEYGYLTLRVVFAPKPSKEITLMIQTFSSGEFVC